MAHSTDQLGFCADNDVDLDGHVDMTLTCADHKGMIWDTYCEEHDELLCYLCASINHRSCKNVLSIEQMLKSKTKKSKELKHFKDGLSALVQKLSKLKLVHIETKETLRKETDNACKEITDFRNLINWALDKMEKKGKELMEKRFKKLSKDVNEKLERCEEMLEVMNQLKVSFSECDDPVRTLIKMKTSQNALMRAQKLYEESKANNHREIVKFTVDPKVEQLARSLGWYGKDRTYLSFEPPLSFPRLYTIKHGNQFDVRVKGDMGTCMIIDSCQLDDGTILLADSANKRIKQLDVHYNVIDHCGLPGNPTAVCKINNKIAAVSLEIEEFGSVVRYIDLSYNNTLQVLPDTGFNINANCQGLSALDNNILIATSDKLCVYSLSGDLIEELYTKSSKSINRVRVSNNASKLFIIDAQKGLVTLDRNGSVLNTVNDSCMKGASDIAIDINDQILVGNCEAHNIIQVNHDGNILGSVSDHSVRIKYPVTLTFDKIHSRLIIASKSSNVVKVFELQ